MSKVAVITGANRGIGLAMTNQLINRGYYVYAVCRQSSAALEALDVEVVSGVDVTNTHALEDLAKRLVGRDINLLINNAGILHHEDLNDLNQATIEQQFLVNAMAPVAVTVALQGLFKAGSKVAMITSRMGSIADNGSGGYYGYRMSKAALNAASVSLANDLRDREVSVGIYHPGFVQTDMVGHQGDISAEVAAERLINLMEAQDMSQSGVFKHSNGQNLPW
ncbi:SDR family oxidoreductase [Psychrobium sp. 1_MG-2023]|uniref:SDR family oxidoreductase n=1 Tax=Psychrobium sp. 1_MG-2023 TaxID=3062624 RepID=UPI000C33A0A7|nr:SDR family oxidoreductase [Psychrobium sp. 1_MG-2023]MDP2559607.1 SDR family oxidoreductase [Psychrobium sp. 1_MG-2023]PKF59441.1 short-chain dehydrogenase [Alteromonadales bacterium alter-6D02]